MNRSGEDADIGRGEDVGIEKGGGGLGLGLGWAWGWVGLGGFGV